MSAGAVARGAGLPIGTLAGTPLRRDGELTPEVKRLIQDYNDLGLKPRINQDGEVTGVSWIAKPLSFDEGD